MGVVRLFHLAFPGKDTVVVTGQRLGPYVALPVSSETGDVGNIGQHLDSFFRTEQAQVLQLSHQERTVGQVHDGQAELRGNLLHRLGRVLIESVRGGPVQGAVGPADHLPAGLVNPAHRNEALAFQTEQSLERTHHERRTVHGDAGYLATKAFLFREVRIDFGYGNAENTVIRCAPYRFLAVVGQFGHAVGAESVAHIQTPDLTAPCIDGDDAVCRGGQQRAVGRDGQALIHLYLLPSVNGGSLDAFASGKNLFSPGIPFREIDTDGISFERQDAACLGNAFKNDVAVFPQLQTHDAGDVGGMDDSPFNVVVDKKAFEIGKIGTSLAVADDIEITVVGIVQAGRIVPEERDTHIGISPLPDSRLPRKGPCDEQEADMKQRLSHLNGI